MASLATPQVRYSADRVEPLRRPDLAIRNAITLAPSTTFTKGRLLAEVTGTNEIQTLTLGGTGVGSTFTLTFTAPSGVAVTSAAITWSATTGTLVANIQAALDAMSNVGVNNTVVANSTLSSGLGDVTVTFKNDLGSINVAILVAAITAGSLTVTPAETTAGVAGAKGLYTPYVAGNSDGTQNAKCIMPFACITDASGLITLGDGTLGNDNFSKKVEAYAWFGGIFRCDEVFISATAQIDATAITSLKALVIEGSLLVRGVFKF